MLKAGDKAPTFALVDQHGKKRTLKEFAKRKVLVYFYPKADTPGCTQQSCLLRISGRRLVARPSLVSAPTHQQDS